MSAGQVVMAAAAFLLGGYGGILLERRMAWARAKDRADGYPAGSPERLAALGAPAEAVIRDRDTGARMPGLEAVVETHRGTRPRNVLARDQDGTSPRIEGTLARRARDPWGRDLGEDTPPLRYPADGEHTPPPEEYARLMAHNPGDVKCAMHWAMDPSARARCLPEDRCPKCRPDE